MDVSAIRIKEKVNPSSREAMVFETKIRPKLKRRFPFLPSALFNKRDENVFNFFNFPNFSLCIANFFSELNLHCDPTIFFAYFHQQKYSPFLSMNKANGITNALGIEILTIRKCSL